MKKKIILPIAMAIVVVVVFLVLALSTAVKHSNKNKNNSSETGQNTPTPTYSVTKEPMQNSPTPVCSKGPSPTASVTDTPTQNSPAPTVPVTDAPGENTPIPTSAELITPSAVLQDENYFKVPYVSTYYFNPKPSTEEEIRIPLYLTDSEQSEYLKNDTTAVVDLVYKLDGVTRTVENVPLGDYTLLIGKLSEGMHSVSLQVLDKRTGLKSHELFNELWVISPEKAVISEAETYYMTRDDLARYSINNENSKEPEDCINTRDGLNRLFLKVQSEGYRKIVLLPGIYRINGEKTDTAFDSTQVFYISIPTHFTVDMNGSTFKLDTITNNHQGCIVQINDAFDSHIMNGILEGDRFERKELGLESEEANIACEGEPINTLMIQGCKYCSASNIIVKNTTGHAVGGGGIFGPEYTFISSTTKTAIFNGVEKESEVCSTSDFIDLKKIMDWEEFDGYIFVAHLLGYKGIQGESPIEYISFYDENKKYIETVVGYQYRKIRVPQGAAYLRATFLGDIETTGYEHTITVYTQHLGDYISYVNLDFYDTRTTALVASCGSNILIEGCTFTRCGCSITPVAVDFEEGGEECQDLYYRNNTVFENAETTTGTVVDCAGFNHVYENNTGHLIEIRNRVMGLVLRDTFDEGSQLIWFPGTEKTAKFGRIYDNDCGYIQISDASLSDELKPKMVEIKVKNCTLHCGSYAEGINAVAGKVTYENCSFPNFFGSKATLKGCTVCPAWEIGVDLHFEDCIFKAPYGEDELYLELPYIGNRVFDGCEFTGKTVLGSSAYRLGFQLGTFRNCEFEELKLYLRAEEDVAATVFENCIIKKAAEDFIYIGAATEDEGLVKLEFKGCTITQEQENSLIYLYAKPCGDSTILFEDCIISKKQGKLLEFWDDDYNPVKNQVALKVLFKNTAVDSGLFEAATAYNTATLQIVK